MRGILKLAVPLALLAQVGLAEGACDRACLIDTAKAVAMGGAAAEARTTLNGEVVAADTAWGLGASDVHVHNAYADEGSGQVMVVGTGTGADGAPAIFGLRAKVADGKEVVRHYDPRSLYLFEAFKVVDGKVAQIEATMRDLAFEQVIDWPN